MPFHATSPTRNARSLPLGSPRSPTSPQCKQQVPPGFRPSVRPKRRPIAEMTIRELQDLRRLNTTILASPYAIFPSQASLTPIAHAPSYYSGASTSSYVHRVQAEQAAIESRLLELDGIETINTGLKETKIRGEDDMIIDLPEPPTSRIIEAKKRALARFVGF